MVGFPRTDKSSMYYQDYHVYIHRLTKCIAKMLTKYLSLPTSLGSYIHSSLYLVKEDYE